MAGVPANLFTKVNCPISCHRCPASDMLVPVLYSIHVAFPEFRGFPNVPCYIFDLVSFSLLPGTLSWFHLASTMCVLGEAVVLSLSAFVICSSQLMNRYFLVGTISMLVRWLHCRAPLHLTFPGAARHPG